MTMAATLVVPYVFPLLLGMTYDARNDKPGVDIYDMKYVDNPQITNISRVATTYKVVTKMSDVTDQLNIEGDLSLKIKTGMVDISGKGSYIKNTRDFKKEVEILSTLKWTSKVKALGQDSSPKIGWESLYNPAVLGTHFVSSITYGAEMIASARFVAFNSSDTAEIRGEVEAVFGTDGSGADLTASGKLDKLSKKLEGKSNLEISYYGTVPLRSIPNSIDGLTDLINKFAEQIEQTDLKEGIPMNVELTPLTSICKPEDEDKFKFNKNKVLINELADFEEQFDEMRNARLDLTSWAKGLPYDLNPDYEKEIGKLIKNMTKVLEVFYGVVWQMDLSKGPDQLKPAFDAYNYDGDDVYLRFEKLVRKLKAKLGPLIKRDDVTSDTYVQWGNNNCTAPGTVVLYKGFAASSSEEGIGGSSEYTCTPADLEKGYDLNTQMYKMSHLSGIRYTDLDSKSNPFMGPYAKKVPGQGIACAKCHSPDSQSVAMFSAKDQCPLTWEIMYEGYLMAARVSGHTTEYICVDSEPSEPYKMDAQPRSADTAALTVVKSSGSLPSDPYKDGALLKCIVCSMKSNQVAF